MGPPHHGWTVSQASPAHPGVPVSDLGAWRPTHSNLGQRSRDPASHLQGQTAQCPRRMGHQSTCLQPPVAAGRSAGGGAACLGLEAGPPAGAAAPPLGTARQGAQPGARGAVPSWEQHGCWHSPSGLVCPVTTAEVPGCGWMSCDRRPGGPHGELGGRDGHPCTSGCRPGRGQQGG